MIGKDLNLRLRRLALTVWTVIGIAVLIGIVIWVASEIRIIWLPLAFGCGIAVILEPVVRWLSRWNIPRVFGTTLAFIFCGGMLVGVGFLVFPVIQEQSSQFGEQLPELYDSTVERIVDFGDSLGLDLDLAWNSDTVRDWIADPDNQETIQTLLSGFGAGAGRLLRGVTEVFVVVLLAPVLAFYLLLDFPRIQRMVRELTPVNVREEVIHVMGAATRAVGAFVRGQLLVALIVGVLSSIGLFLIDMPFWLIIGLLAGLLNLIPFVGPFVGGALALIVGVFAGDLTKGLLAVALFTAIQQLDNHLITPIVQKARVQLSPLVIVLALIIGGSAAGLLGVLVAVPLMAVLRIVAGHLWRTRVLKASWEEAEEAMISPTRRPERSRARSSEHS